MVCGSRLGKTLVQKQEHRATAIQALEHLRGFAPHRVPSAERGSVPRGEAKKLAESDANRIDSASKN